MTRGARFRSVLPVLALLASLSGCSEGYDPPAPEVATYAPTSVTSDSATLHGAAALLDQGAEAWFEWGEDATLAVASTTARVTIVQALTPVSFDALITGLSPATTYHVRAMAENEAGSAGGEILSFTTLAAAPGVATNLPSLITSGGAVLQGAVAANGSDADAWFEWGQSYDLSDATSTTPVAISGSSPSTAYTTALAGLSPATTYYVRAVAENGVGTTFGDIRALTTDPAGQDSLVVNSLADVETPGPGEVTLREAVRTVAPGGKILFDPSLDGGTIPLTLVEAEHSVLRGEVFSGMPPTFQGYLERDYGRSALYAAKSLTLDASALPHGITVAWAGSPSAPARVLGVYGDLTLRNLTITSGHSKAVAISGTQPWTLARGGGVAVWGQGTFERCTIAGNRVEGDLSPARDRGAFGGGVYGERLHLSDCVVSGNRALGFGAAGGGVYSVGGPDDWSAFSLLEMCSVTGNRVTAQHAYGGGVYSDGGGPGMLNYLWLEECTIARNLVEDHPGLPQVVSPFQFYYRGGGVYMSNGYLNVNGCTIAENKVAGSYTVFASSGRPNMGGGGMGATIGDAHTVEAMEISHSIIAGNTLNGQADDVYTGSLLDFFSFGYNRIGKLDFSRILVPIPWWRCLSRKHYPKAGDEDGVTLAEVVDVEGAVRHATVVSAGADSGEKAVLWYPPAGSALDRIPPEEYRLPIWMGEYTLEYGATDDFLMRVLAKLRADFPEELGTDFGLSFGDLTGVTFYGPATTWPSDPANAEWIAFWRELDLLIGDKLGTAGLGDDWWSTWPTGDLGGGITLYMEDWGEWNYGPFKLLGYDQLGNARPAGEWGDIGAVEEEK